LTTKDIFDNDDEFVDPEWKMNKFPNNDTDKTIQNYYLHIKDYSNWKVLRNGKARDGMYYSTNTYIGIDLCSIFHPLPFHFSKSLQIE
jgi:hypothetical protein